MSCQGLLGEGLCFDGEADYVVITAEVPVVERTRPLVRPSGADIIGTAVRV